MLGLIKYAIEEDEDRDVEMGDESEPEIEPNLDFDPLDFSKYCLI